jgi:hypothetical protein
MTSLVGWYIHHHGAGHLTRFLAVRPHLDAEVVVFSSLPRPASLPPATSWNVLPRDDDPIEGSDGALVAPDTASPTANGLLHWAPLRHRGHASRLARIARDLGERSYGAFVVDVSAEVTLLVRLLGVAPVVMTQPGDRSDAPHLLAFQAAERIIAPWPAGAHRPIGAGDVEQRVAYVGGISRFDGRPPVPVVAGSVLFLGGGASDAPLVEGLLAAARATPGSRWTALGVEGAAGYTGHPWVDDPWPLLASAEVVVAAAGQNSIADLAAAGARAVVIPQPRPFAEQEATGRLLAADALATVVEGWPDADRWPALLERARLSEPRWTGWQVTGAAARAAAVIAEVAR